MFSFLVKRHRLTLLALFFFSFSFFIEMVSFEADLAKKKHVNMMMCHLTTKTNYGVIANGTKLHGVKSNF